MKLSQLLRSIMLGLFAVLFVASGPVYATSGRTNTMYMQKENGKGVDVIPYVMGGRRHLFVDFSARDLAKVEWVKYNVNYDTNDGLRGAEGMKWLLKDEMKYFKGVPYVRQHIVLGTCSKNVCRYDANPRNFRLTVTTKYVGKAAEHTRVISFN